MAGMETRKLQYTAYEICYFINEMGGVRVELSRQKLAAQIGCTRQTLDYRVDKLIRAGILKKEPGEISAKNQLLSLSVPSNTLILSKTDSRRKHEKLEITQLLARIAELEQQNNKLRETIQIMQTAAMKREGLLSRYLSNTPKKVTIDRSGLVHQIS